MNFTWKGDETKNQGLVVRNAIVPTNSRPFTANDPIVSVSSDDPLELKKNPFGRPFGKANPLKHWRKQLMPEYATKSSKQVSLDRVNAPSGAILSKCDCSSSNAQLLKENIIILNSCTGTRDGNRCVGGSHNVRRSASTNLNKNYYRNYSKYLQAKCRTYESNTHLGAKNDNNTYQGSKCHTESCPNKQIIYKPSNTAFMQQGSVSSSANTLRKRNNAITNNSSSLRTAYGNSIVHGIRYIDETNNASKIRYVKGDNNSSSLCRQQFKDCTSSS